MLVARGNSGWMGYDLGESNRKDQFQQDEDRYALNSDRKRIRPDNRSR